MKYTTLLLDVDDTLLDFLRCEENAFLKTCEEYKIENAQQIYPRYSQINDNVWKELELGQIERKEVVVERFRRLFKELNLSYDPAEFNFNYRQNLSLFYFYIDGAEDFLKQIKGKFTICAMTNGIKFVQDIRLKESGLCNYFDKIFISEESGYAKPDRRFFDWAIDRVEEKDRAKILMIGDSLTSDMKGGLNADIDTCWFNPHNKENYLNLPLTYTVKTYDEILKILL